MFSTAHAVVASAAASSAASSSTKPGRREPRGLHDAAGRGDRRSEKRVERLHDNDAAALLREARFQGCDQGLLARRRHDHFVVVVV